MLTIKKMTKALGGRVLFENSEMTINWGERVALVGPNGAGKSTLFKIVLKEEDADQGTVDLDEYGMVGYLAQEAGNPGNASIMEIAMGITAEHREVLETMRTMAEDSEEFGKSQDRWEELNGYQLEPKAKKILSGLGYSQEDFDRPADMFSGGWIMRAHLARLLVEEPDLLSIPSKIKSPDGAAKISPTIFASKSPSPTQPIAIGSWPEPLPIKMAVLS